jgi:chemotaxis protein methyltransferase CheR
LAGRWRIDEALLDVIEEVLRNASGMSLSSGMRRALPAAVEDAAASVALEPQAFLHKLISGDDSAVAALVERAVVGETFFWRHPEQFEALRALVLGTEAPLNLWSAGCASGEEPYSVAMALLEAGRAGRGDRVLATDLSSRALSRARQAKYGAWSLRRTPEDIRGRYFTGAPPVVDVTPRVRELVTLARHNLVREPPPGQGFDVVLCRNVLIYFDPVLAVEVLYKLLSALRPGGVLFLGPVELPLAAQVDVEWVEAEGATVLRRRADPPAAPGGSSPPST